MKRPTQSRYLEQHEVSKIKQHMKLTRVYPLKRGTHLGLMR